MKTLASCKPSEFLRQTSRIKKSVEKWLTDTDILNIRARKPEYEVAEKGISTDERKALIERNAAKEREQVKKNLSAMFDAILDQHPDETLEIMALCCFIEPEDADNHTVREYITAMTELLNDQDVVDFFTSLARLAQINSGSVSKA